MGVAAGAEEAELQLPHPVPAEPRPVQRPAGGTHGQAAPHILLQPQVGGGPKIYLVSEEKYLIAVAVDSVNQVRVRDTVEQHENMFEIHRLENIEISLGQVGDQQGIGLVLCSQ